MTSSFPGDNADRTTVMRREKPMTFERWMKKVDRALYGFSSMESADLPDQPWRDWYNDEMPPIEAAQECLTNEDFPWDEVADDNMPGYTVG